MENDLIFMNEALIEAKKAFEKKEVPVGAIIVFQNEIIARAHNCMESMQDPTAHAEILCIQRAAKYFGNWRLHDATLYSTLEPCSMCAGALFLSRLKRIVWGAPDLRHGAGGSLVDLFSLPHPTHAIEISKGILSEKSSFLLKQFFQLRRECRMSLKN